MSSNSLELEFAIQGAFGWLWRSTDMEVVCSGAAGTGKTRAILELLHYRLSTTPGLRVLMLRKTYVSLKGSAMVTFDEQVKPDLDGVVFKGDTMKRPAHYSYPNGSTLTVGGLDNWAKVLSSEYHLVYVNEVTEIDVSSWEALMTRINRPGRPKPLGFNQLLGDCNPNAPSHWIRQRADTRLLTLIPTVHEDNPSIYDPKTGEYTEDGKTYIATLDRLTGVRYARFRLGLWAAAEGMVYEDVWRPEKNIKPRAEYSRTPKTLFGDAGLPRDWPRYLAVDFGYTHPFVCRWYAEDPDGRLIMYREIYHTHRLVEDHAKTIVRYSKWGQPHGDPVPRRIFCDHDAEDRATLERHIGLVTTPAVKTVSDGIQAVASRLRDAGDGKPRLIYLEDSTIEHDPFLADLKQPTRGLDEIELYIWDATKEQPVKEYDHACDTDRYLVASLDTKPRSVTVSEFNVY
jgi:hypothetical protein